ncbi:hypothetical protein BXZ70DRAFT_1008833 [Cristinia sonorae]|uniref:Uncharacterized protein n=1 Tax=Cristinia sonorae TaxID=1940300 RepID=A0A8K0XP40_9AGAR|nr:hypothetical protein BXZ70DRAFT_1008833 [Cristinia sonorae]
MSDNDYNNPRPSKRMRLDNNEPPPSSLSTLTASPSTPVKLRVLQPPALLASLPGLLLAHPPNHKSYVLSLNLSLNALRKCLSMPALVAGVGMSQAWMGLAEIGMRVHRGRVA